MIRRLLPRLLGAASVIALAVLALPALSRPAEDEGSPLGKVSPDLALVPRDAFFFMSGRPADLADLPALKAAFLLPPLDKGIEAMKEAMGFGPDGIERITVFARSTWSEFGPPPVLTVFRTKKDADKDAIKKALRLENEATVHGKTISHSRDWMWGPTVWFADDKTFVIGQAEGLVPYLATLAKPGKNHLLAEELKVADGTHALTMAVLPRLMFRQMEASFRAREEMYRKGREERMKDRRFLDKDGPPPDFPKEKKIGARRRARPEFVALQKEGPERRLEDLKEPDLKLKGFDEAAEAMESDWRGRELFMFKSVVRANRALATLDIDKKSGELKLALKATFPTEADAKDGHAAADFGRITAREAATPDSRLRKENPAAADLLKPFGTAFGEAVVKQDKKVVSTEVKVKPDLVAAVKTVIEGGGLWFGFGESKKDPPKDRRFIDKDKK
ncbi:MAG: hypothetical protein K2W96_00720 [Gemmataceae bacterium]|nr:hypothetical protein [Gemmataceae bacterium]